MNDRINKLPKWAREEIEALRQKVKGLEALTATEEPVERDLPPPKEHGSLSRGWNYNTYLALDRAELTSDCVYKACSSSIFHGRGWERTSTQRPAHLFSTRGRALRALRQDLVRHFTTLLGSVSDEIRKEDGLNHE